MRAEYLKVGQRFECPDIKNVFKNGVCLRVSYSGVYVEAQEYRLITQTEKNKKTGITKVKEKKMKWVPVKCYISCGTEIEPLDEIVDITKNEDNLLISSNKTGKRGRRATEIIFPASPFEVKDVADINSCSTTKIYLKVISMVKDGTAKIVKTIKNKRGKDKKIYQLTKYIEKKNEKTKNNKKTKKGKNGKRNLAANVLRRRTMVAKKRGKKTKTSKKKNR